MTPARQEIIAAHEHLIELLKARAAEHTRRGFPERAHKILAHAQVLSGRLDLIQWDWENFDKEGEPY